MIVEEIKRTSQEWQELKPEIVVYDPDGWDRKNYQYSWFEELITEDEYNRRLCFSTCLRGMRFFNKDGSSVDVKCQ